MILSAKRYRSHSSDSFDAWGVAPSCWNHCFPLTTPLLLPKAVQNFLVVTLSIDGDWTLVFIFKPGRTNQSMLRNRHPCCAFHSATALADNPLMGLSPRRCCSLSSHVQTMKSAPHKRIKHPPETLGSHHNLRILVLLSKLIFDLYPVGVQLQILNQDPSNWFPRNAKFLVATVYWLAGTVTNRISDINIRRRSSSLGST